MTPTVQLAILCGLVAGCGVALVALGFARPQPDLGDALARLDTQHVESVELEADGLQNRIGHWLQKRSGGVPGLRIPASDLAVLRISPHEFLGEKALLGLVGLLFPAALGTLAALAGYSLPLFLPAGGSLVLAIGFFLLPSLTVRERAQRARAEFGRTVGAFIELVALERLGGTGTSQALENAAAVGDSWAMQRIREELLRSRLSGVTPWAGMRRLAVELGVPELEDLADIMRLAGEEGAQVYEALRARGRSLRTAMLATEQARANSRSESMVVPVALLAFVFLGLLAAPAFARILGTS